MLLKPIIAIRNQLQTQIYFTSGTSTYFGSHQYYVACEPKFFGAPDAQQLQVLVTKSNHNSGLKNEFYIFD